MRAFGILTGMLSLLAASPALAQTPPHLAELETRIIGTANENPGEYGIAALDLATGEVIGVNTDMAFPMASTMKIAVAAAYLSDVDAGRRSLDDGIAGTTALALMDRMMVRSDNHATDLLIARLGGPASVDSWIDGTGYASIARSRSCSQPVVTYGRMRTPRRPGPCCNCSGAWTREASSLRRRDPSSST